MRDLLQYRLFRLLAAAACFGAVEINSATHATAQHLPSRPITIVVPYSAGGQADVLSRAVGHKLGEILNAAVVIENKPGGNTLIGSEAVARSAPDGRTILLVTDGMTTIDPQLPGENGFNPATQLDLVINMAIAPLFLSAKKDLPVNSLAELIAYGKAHPGELTFGTPGSATPHRIAGEMIAKLGGFHMMNVAYKGTAASVSDLAGGHISLVIGASTALAPLAASGQIKLLAVTSEKRFSQLPTVPAVSETIPGFDVVSYLGLAVANGTPASIDAGLNATINTVLSDPELRDFLATQGMIPAGGSAADFTTRVAADLQARGRIIRELKLTSE